MAPDAVAKETPLHLTGKEVSRLSFLTCEQVKSSSKSRSRHTRARRTLLLEHSAVDGCSRRISSRVDPLTGLLAHFDCKFINFERWIPDALRADIATSPTLYRVNSLVWAHTLQLQIVLLPPLLNALGEAQHRGRGGFQGLPNLSKHLRFSSVTQDSRLQAALLRVVDTLQEVFKMIEMMEDDDELDDAALAFIEADQRSKNFLEEQGSRIVSGAMALSNLSISDA